MSWLGATRYRFVYRHRVCCLFVAATTPHYTCVGADCRRDRCCIRPGHCYVTVTPRHSSPTSLTCIIHHHIPTVSSITSIRIINLIEPVFYSNSTTYWILLHNWYTSFFIVSETIRGPCFLQIFYLHYLQKMHNTKLLKLLSKV